MESLNTAKKTRIFYLFLLSIKRFFNCESQNQIHITSFYYFFNANKPCCAEKIESKY